MSYYFWLGAEADKYALAHNLMLDWVEQETEILFREALATPPWATVTLGGETYTFSQPADLDEHYGHDD